MRGTRSLRAILLASALAFAVTGCASNRSTMVSFSPSQSWDSRTSPQLLADFNRVMPFEIKSGDFVGSRGVDGPTCWVCLDDPEETRALFAVLRKEPDWRFRSSGSLKTKDRPLFGLEPIGRD